MDAADALRDLRRVAEAEPAPARRRPPGPRRALPAFRFFGSTLAREGRLTFPVAEPEKAIVDAFYLPCYCGGMDRVIAAVLPFKPIPRSRTAVIRKRRRMGRGYERPQLLGCRGV